MELNKNLLKKKLNRFSILISSFLYIIISLDFFVKQNYYISIGIGVIGILNLFILKIQNKNLKLFGILVNALSFLASGLIFINHYQQNERYILWGTIAIAYLVVTIMFVFKRKRVN